LFSDHLCGNCEKTDAFSYLIHVLLPIQILKTNKFAMYINNVKISKKKICNYKGNRTNNTLRNTRHNSAIPCSRVLPSKKRIPYLVKKCPTFHGNRMCITVFIVPQPPSPSQINPIHNTILILSFLLWIRVPNCICPSAFAAASLGVPLSKK